jgi:hypothetical protein
VDQHLVAAADVAAREGNAAIELVDGRRLEVGRRQVKEVDSGVAQALLVVAVLLAQIDDGADPVVRGEVLDVFDRKASADGEMVGQPVEVGRPGRFFGHAIFFIFFFAWIFFFIIRRTRYCCLQSITVVLSVTAWNNKASQMFRAHMFFHSNSEPIRE